MKITLLDGNVKDFENGLSIYEMAKSLSIGLAKKGKLIKILEKL